MVANHRESATFVRFGVRAVRAPERRYREASEMLSPGWVAVWRFVLTVHRPPSTVYRPLGTGASPGFPPCNVARPAHAPGQPGRNRLIVRATRAA